MRPKYIMNERKYIESVMLSKKYEIDKDFSKDLYTLIKYYCAITEYNKEETFEKVIDFILKHKNKQNKLDEKEWEDFINKSINIMCKYEKKLRELDRIYITESDWSYITSLSSREDRKTLFTMIGLSKLINNDTPNESKITYSFNEIFKLANMSSLKRNVRQDIIKSLKDVGLINTEVIKDKKTKDRKIVYRVECSINQGENLFYVCDISSLGRKYSDMKKLLDGENLKQCEVCGCLVETKLNDYSSKYCDECKKIMKNEQNKEYFRKSLTRRSL